MVCLIQEVRHILNNMRKTAVHVVLETRDAVNIVIMKHVVGHIIRKGRQITKNDSVEVNLVRVFHTAVLDLEAVVLQSEEIHLTLKIHQ